MNTEPAHYPRTLALLLVAAGAVIHARAQAVSPAPEAPPPDPVVLSPFEGWLKGASASVNFRYRGPRLIGFPTRVDAGGRTRVDRDNPYKSDDYLLTGAMLNYRFRGVGNTAWRLQLNANNLFNTKRLYLTRAFNDGTPRNYGRQPGREFIFTVDIEH